MSNLHAYYALRNLQGFSKALDASSRGQTGATQQPSGASVNHGSSSASSSGGGKSWTTTSTTTRATGALAQASVGGTHVDVNARDWLGRTVLHVACAEPETCSSLAYVRLLLAHPSVNVNLQDAESRWTALHRALYAGNVAVSQLLMQRSDVDVELRDSEGLTAFDLYNSTVDGTRPNVPEEALSLRGALEDSCAADLFTWGGNRNAALGHGDGGDRTYPDHVVIKDSVVSEFSSDKLSPIQVREVGMAKLHTTIITTENRGNLRACGFGSGGRLGPGQHTQYNLLPMPQFTHHVVAIALGQDHTLALTSDGEVLSWGLNRFSQLGYVVEPPAPFGALHARARDEPIQAVARKVVGPLKKEIVIGVAACKTASACWTRSDVYTWGTNHGQLGYDRVAQPVQIIPRKVTGVQAVTDLAMTDSAMSCLLETRDVICFRDDARFRLKFPTPELSDFSPYVPPFIVRPPITKLTSCEDTFAALSSRGEVFTFSVPPAPADGATDRVERAAVKPQRVWSLRKSLNPARDVALGSDGDLILCTESGHVFVRSRSSKASASASGKALKFHRVPFIHRAVKVCANTTGAFGALRLNYSPLPVSVFGSTVIDDLKSVRPWESAVNVWPSVHIPAWDHLASVWSEDDPEEGGLLEADIGSTFRMCFLLTDEKAAHKSEAGMVRVPERLTHGADVIVRTTLDLPAHRVVLSSRCHVLRDLMEGRSAVVQDSAIAFRYHTGGTQLPRLVVTGCHPITVLLFLEYMYSDDFPALWDRRVSVSCGHLFKPLRIDPMQVKTELAIIARMLNLRALYLSLSVSVKCFPTPTIPSDMRDLFRDISTSISALKPDVFLELADAVMPCHSVILRARCPFFRSFFDDEDWTARRWSPAGTLSVDMKHLEWRVVSFVVAWLYDGNDTGMIDQLRDSVETIPDLLDSIFGVMAVASELLLDKLMLICSTAILRHVTLTNVVSILAEATYYNALSLVGSLQDYVACNLEAIMESRFLDDMDPGLVMALSAFVRSRQEDKSPIMRSNTIVESALRKQSNWLELQDLPQPIVRSRWSARESPPKLDPPAPDQSSLLRSFSSVPPARSPLSSPNLGATVRPSPPRTPRQSQGEDIFPMEDFPMDSSSIPTLHIGQPQPPPPSNYTVPGQAWKSKSPHVPVKVDMKTIMAETATASAIPQSSVGTPATSVGTTEMISVPGPSTSRSFHKPSQRQRRKIDGQTPLVGSEPAQQQVVSSVLPWKLPPDRQAPTAAGAGSSSVREPPQSDPAMRAMHSTSLAPWGASSQPSKAQPSTPMPVLPAASSWLRSDAIPELVPRRSHADAPAWTAAMSASAGAPEPLTAAQMSFVAIQQQQREQVVVPHQSKGKRSLREIQEEEQAKQEEEDFLKWWTAEEQRLKAAESQVAADTRPPNPNPDGSSSSSSPGRERRAGRRGSARTFRDGRGRGGGSKQ